MIVTGADQTISSTRPVDNELQIRAEEVEERKTVLIASNTTIFGGAEKHLLDFLGSFNSTVIRPAILCVDGDPFTGRLPAGLPVKVLRPKKPLRSVFRWAKLLLEVRPHSVIFIHGVLSSFDSRGYLAARLVGVRSIISVHHLIAPSRPAKITGKSFRSLALRIGGWRTRFLVNVRLLASLCHKIICVSDAVRRSLVKEYGFPGTKMFVVHNGVDVRTLIPSNRNSSAIRDRLGIDHHETVLVCVARLSPMKGLDVLLSSLHKLKNKGHAFKAIIVGDGPLKSQLAEMIETYGLTGSVFLEGFQKNVCQYLQMADVFVLSSYREGLPLSVLEAMACGLPCIVTDVGGNSEAVTNGQDGIIVSPGSIDKLSDAIEQLLSCKEIRLHMAAAARRTACTRFDIRVRMREFEELIFGRPNDACNWLRGKE